MNILESHWPGFSRLLKIFRIWNELQKGTNIRISKWNKRARFYLNPIRSRCTFMFGRKLRGRKPRFLLRNISMCWVGLQKRRSWKWKAPTAVDHNPTFEVGNLPSTYYYWERIWFKQNVPTLSKRKPMEETKNVRGCFPVRRSDRQTRSGY